MTTCTLVLEYNYAKKSAGDGTVWIFSGDGSADLARSEPFQQMSGWIKVAGPLPYDTAAGIQQALKDFFTRSGVGVIDKGVAD